MEPHDNKMLSLQKAISSHEQAAAGLADVIECFSAQLYETMLARIRQNIEDLHAEVARSQPGDQMDGQ
jgi:hypothetical protein